jgi:hypothetical protein
VIRAEISPSGRGLRIIAQGHVPKPMWRWNSETGKRVTIRDHHFSFTLTGDHLAGTPWTIEERQEAITRLYQSAEAHARRQRKTLADILHAEFPPMRWAIPELLPEGCMLLGGRPKAGKSLLVLNIALAVATGGTALSQYSVEAGDVLYYDLEGNERRLQKRAIQMLSGNTEGILSTRLSP